MSAMDKPMTLPDLKKLREVAEKATPGPWIEAGPSFGAPIPRYTDEIVTVDEDEDGDVVSICEMPFAHHDEQNEANAAFIATSNPQTILALLDAYEAIARDAEMYRYIRESQAEFVHYIGGGTHGLYEGIELDRRVSAAITEEVGRNAPKGE